MTRTNNTIGNAYMQKKRSVVLKLRFVIKQRELLTIKILHLEQVRGNTNCNSFNLTDKNKFTHFGNE